MTGDRAAASDTPPDLVARRKRLIFRAWHRGTKEADLILGHFVERHVSGWGHEEIAWAERLLTEADADILDWVVGRKPVPAAYDTEIMRAMQALDYLPASD